MRTRGCRDPFALQLFKSNERIWSFRRSLGKTNCITCQHRRSPRSAHLRGRPTNYRLAAKFKRTRRRNSCATVEISYAWIRAFPWGSNPPDDWPTASRGRGVTDCCGIGVLVLHRESCSVDNLDNYRVLPSCTACLTQSTQLRITCAPAYSGWNCNEPSM